MNDDNQPLTKKDFEETIGKLQETLVGGMNQMLEKLIRHMDGVVDHLDPVDLKLDNSTDDLTQRLAKLEKQQA